LLSEEYREPTSSSAILKLTSLGNALATLHLIEGMAASEAIAVGSPRVLARVVDEQGDGSAEEFTKLTVDASGSRGILTPL
jgi:hypothetical protein